MTEDDARSWCAARYSLEQMGKLATFADMVVEENAAQNLIAPATCASIWVRHMMDSAQLLAHRPVSASNWLDVGSGAGFPGLVIGILFEGDVTLVEPRTRRADFLARAAKTLDLSNVSVIRAKVEALTGTFDVISARAVASLPVLLAITRHLHHGQTRMILPRGRNGAIEVEQLPDDKCGMFHVEHSLTDAESVIVVADGVTI